MSAKGYTDKTSIENYLLQTIDSSFNSQIDAWIQAVEAFIDKLTSRNFVADASGSESTRLYDGNGGYEMEFDDFIVEGATDLGKLILKIGDPAVTISNSNIYLEPANTDRKRKIILKENVFTAGRQVISLTARFGYSAAVPADIKMAATILVAGITNYSNNTKGKVQSETIGRYSVSYKTDQGWNDYKSAIDIIKSYKKYTF